MSIDRPQDPDSEGAALPGFGPSRRPPSPGPRRIESPEEKTTGEAIPADPPRPSLGQRLAGMRDRFSVAGGASGPEKTARSSLGSSSEADLRKVLYVVVRGSTGLADRIFGQRLGRSITASPLEARGMAAPLASYIGRRVEVEGDTADTVSVLQAFFGVTNWLTRVLGLAEPDGTEPEAPPPDPRPPSPPPAAPAAIEASARPTSPADLLDDGGLGGVA